MGDSSIKITPIGTGRFYADVNGTNSFNEHGKTVTFTVEVYSNVGCNLYIYELTDLYNNRSVFIPANTPGTYQVTMQISNDSSHEWYRVVSNSTSLSEFIYTDNWRLTFQ